MDFIDEYYADKDLSLLKKLTLVIPTYNRNYYLSRCLWYHAHFPFGQIIVADSSPEEKKVMNRKTIAKVREIFGINILYLEYEDDDDNNTYGGDIFRKWGDAVLHVETEYSEICTDKEFIIPTDTIKGINYLSSNPDYCSVGGQGANVIRDIFHRYVPQVNADEVAYTDDNGCCRVQRCSIEKRMSGLLLSLYRSKDHKLVYQYLRSYNINDLRYGETALELIPLMIGKSFRWAEIGKVRDIHAFQTGILGKIKLKESSCARHIPLAEYPSNLNKLWFESLVACLVDLDTSNKIDAYSSLSDSVLRILDWWMGGQNHHPQTINERYKVFGIVWYLMPYELKYVISQKIGNKLVISPKILHKTKREINIIKRVIKNTQKLYHNDESIIL